MRTIYLFILLTTCFKQAYSQKTFNVVVNFDQSFDPGKVTWSYDGGMGSVYNTDTFTIRQLHLKGHFYGEYATVKVVYGNEDYVLFWVDAKPASISFVHNNLPGKSLLSKNQTLNTILVDESEERKRWTQFGKKELASMNDFYVRNPGQLDPIMTDSVHYLYKQLFSRMMLFIKEKPVTYYAKWFFRDQLVSVAQYLFKNDTAYFSELYDYFNATFSHSYRISEEGRYLGEQITFWEKGREGSNAPYFRATDVKGKIIELSALKGRYVLLDFWATWCPPCMAEIPFIKGVREKYSQEKLAIIGISGDRDLKEWKKGIEEEGMNWLHILDAKEIPLYFGVMYLPQTFLIDKEGRIIYSSRQRDNKEALLRMLEQM